MTNQQKGFVLAGLLIAWGGVTAYQMLGSSDPAPADPSSPMAQTHSSLPSVKALTIDSSFPNFRKLVSFSKPRDIFSPIRKKRITVTKKKRQGDSPPTANIALSPPVPRGPSPEELAAQRAREQLNQFRFLGYLTKGGESQAFLTNGQAIYIVKQGEMLEGQVQVNKIEPETIVLSTQVWETGNQVQATIPLTPETRS